jgi:hypothetical protein
MLTSSSAVRKPQLARAASEESRMRVSRFHRNLVLALADSSHEMYGVANQPSCGSNDIGSSISQSRVNYIWNYSALPMTISEKRYVKCASWFFLCGSPVSRTVVISQNSLTH